MVLSKKYMEVKTVSKKILAFILAACMTLSMTACGDSDSSDAETQSSSFSESESSESDDTSSDESSNESSETESFEVDSSETDSSEDESSKETKKTTKKETDDSSKVTTTKTTAKAVETTTQKPVVTTKPAVQTTKTTNKTTTKTVAKTTTKVTTNPTPDSTLVPRNAFDKPTGKYMEAIKKISKVNAHINKDFTESDCALVREYLINLVYKKYPKSKAHNVKFIPYFDKNGKPSYYDNVLNNGGSYNGANWQYYYGIAEGQIQMFIDDMTYLADVYMYNFDGEPCINGCTNWDIFWMYRSDGVVHFSLAVF